MKSRISIDVDYDNQPVIKIEYAHSDDVRDKLVSMFMSTFEGNSMYATFYFVGSQENGKTALIRPVPPQLLRRNVEIMDEAASHYERNYVKMEAPPLESKIPS